MLVVMSAELSEEGAAACSWCRANLHPMDTVIAVIGMQPFGELVVAVPPFDVLASSRELLDAVERDYCDPLRAHGLRPEALLVRRRQTAAVVAAAVAHDADLVVVGKRPHGWMADAILGEVANQVVHHPPCPIVVVPTDGREPERPALSVVR
jgi:nucleotide-binding universal stress UspA family protein